MDRFGDELLAHAGLSHDQDRRVGWGHPLDERERALDGTALTDDPTRPDGAPRLLAKDLVLAFQTLAQLLHLGERGAELSIHVPPGEHGADHVCHRAEPIQHCRGPRPFRPHRAEGERAKDLAVGD